MIAIEKLIFGVAPAAALAASLIWPGPAAAADSAIDWAGVPAKRVNLFYPGKMSWEWMLSRAQHRLGAKKLRQGGRCTVCHAAEESEMGRYLMSKFEPPSAQPRGRRAMLPVDVKAAHDGETLYLRLEWCRCGAGPIGELDPEYELKVTIMLDDGTVTSFERAGCWAACHEDNDEMGITPGMGAMPKYLPETRSRMLRTGGGSYPRSDDELEIMRERGVFVEYWQARINRDAPPQAVDGYLLDQRHESRAPVVSAAAERRDGTWTVVMSRPLRPGNDWYKPLVPGRTYTLGFAVHEAHATGRRHHVSFEHTLVLDAGQADFVAIKR